MEFVDFFLILFLLAQSILAYSIFRWRKAYKDYIKHTNEYIEFLKK